MNSVIKKIFTLLPSQTVYAHCDIPCGIYDPTAAQTAAKTVLVMVQKLKALEMPGDEAPTEEFTKHHNDVVRMVMNKEEHAQICKKELLILWTDYFKPEHLEKFPELHDTFWKAAKLCSQAKQHVDEDIANQLVEVVDKIAQMFSGSKK